MCSHFLSSASNFLFPTHNFGMKSSEELHKLLMVKRQRHSPLTSSPFPFWAGSHTWVKYRRFNRKLPLWQMIGLYPPRYLSPHYQFQHLLQHPFNFTEQQCLNHLPPSPFKHVETKLKGCPKYLKGLNFASTFILVFFSSQKY